MKVNMELELDEKATRQGLAIRRMREYMDWFKQEMGEKTDGPEKQPNSFVMFTQTDTERLENAFSNLESNWFSENIYPCVVALTRTELNFNLLTSET